MQGIKSPDTRREFVQGPFEYGRSQLYQRDASNDSIGRFAMGYCKLVCVQSSPNLVFNQSARDERPFPKCGRWAAILGEKMRKGYGGV